MKGVIYARYSSDNQREESIEGQIRECMDFAKYNEITIVKSYIDRALSAKTDNRPEFQQMIKDSAKHCFDVIIVWKLDRFARNRYDSAHYKTILKKNGVKVISAKENIGEGSEGILLESVLEGMAEYYSAELSEKVLRGLKENALKGKFNGGGIPMGYIKNKEQKLEIDETLKPIVIDIFKMYANGKTIKYIVQYLKDKGIKTSRNKEISYNVIQRMLSNRKYIGEFKYRDVFIPDGIPAIVPKSLFDRVQMELKKNSYAPGRGKAKENFLLTTKLYCGKCHSFMVGESGTSHCGTVYKYYKCVNARKHKCDKKTVKKDWIEDLAVKCALEVLEDKKIINYLTDKIYSLQGHESSKLPKLREQLNDVNKRIDNMLLAIENGIIMDSTKDRLKELEESKKELDILIAQESIVKPILTKAQIKYGIERYKKLDITKTDGKEKLINGFINSIYLYDDEIKVILNYKDGTKTIKFDEIQELKGSNIELATAPSN